jgi:flavin reductase (DIM6/NTAB) family NADH-FMN oxidoreductase RutF
MRKTSINPFDFIAQPHHLFDRQALLLTVGDFSKGHFNTMTIGWGSIGTMWNYPYVSVVVRPTRYTYEFMEKYKDFTVSAFPAEYKRALTYLGTRSGRDEDKLAATNLTPTASVKVQSPSFEESELTIECRKIYTSDFDPSRFVDPEIDKNYPVKDYHRVYYGEILQIFGTDKYSIGN